MLFQKDKDFKVYVPEGDALSAEYETRLPLVEGGLNQVEEEETTQTVVSIISDMSGQSEDNMITNVTLKNVTILGKPITSLKEMKLSVDDYCDGITVE